MASGWQPGVLGASTKDSDTLITAVCEFSSCSGSEIVSRRLVVGTTTLNDQIPGGKICLFDVDTSNVTKVIKVPFEVTCQNQNQLLANCCIYIEL